MRVKVKCDWCEKEILRYPSQLVVSKHSFCCSKCRSCFLSKSTNPENYIKHKHLSNFNSENNKNRMTKEVKEKLRMARLDKGCKDTYRKINGRHEHRAVAEKMLGRPLRKGEVVHHIDENKRNNKPENLMVFKNQAAHAAWHARKELMPS